MSRTIKAGLVSFGMAGRVFHAPFIHCHPNLELTKVVERHHRKSEEVYPYVEVVPSLEALLEDSSIELVVIAIPNREHYAVAKQAIEAGRHVVLEKPFTVTSAEADELIEKAREQGVALNVYQNRRFDGDFKTVSEIVHQSAIGHVAEYEARFERFRNYRKPGAWRENNEPGAGILYDLGSHLIDQAMVLFGLPQFIYADIRRQRPESEVDDYFSLELDYGNLKCRLQAGMLVKEPGPHFALHGTKGSFVKYGMDPQENRLKDGAMPDDEGLGRDPEEKYGILHVENGQGDERGVVPTRNGRYMDFYDGVYQSLVDNGQAFVDPVGPRNVIRAIELAFESNEKGCRVAMNERF